jgi:hypothetical protein
MKLKVVRLTENQRFDIDAMRADAVAAREHSRKIHLAIQAEIGRAVAGAGIDLADVKWNQLAEDGDNVVVQLYSPGEFRKAVKK